MGVVHGYFEQEQQPSIEGRLVADEQYLSKQFSLLQTNVMKSLQNHQTYVDCETDKYFLGLNLRGSYELGNCAIDFHEELVGWRQQILRKLLHHSYRSVSISFPGEKFDSMPRIDYVRNWFSMSGRREEHTTINDFIDQAYEQTSKGLLTRRQKNIIGLVEQGNTLLQE